VFCFLTGIEILAYRLLQYFVGFASLRVLTCVCTNWGNCAAITSGPTCISILHTTIQQHRCGTSFHRL